MKFLLILISFLIGISCKGKKFKKKKRAQRPQTKIRRTEGRPENINILSIAYELTYNETSVLKAILKTIDDLEMDVSFDALLKTESGQKEYKLSCENVSITLIECYSEKDVKFDLNDKYYFYYKTDGKITLDEKDVLEDYKKVNLIFKPEMYEDQIMWKDHRKILGLNDRKIIGGGYLYLVPKSKKLLHKPKDGFNKYIDLNNFISHAGLYGQAPESSLSAFKEAIRRGYRIVDADVQFTKDKIPVVMHQTNIEKISDGSGTISSLTLKKLEKFDFGSKFSKKYAGEKILTFEDLLILCKENDVIIDLDLAHLDFKKYFVETDEYMKILLNMIEKYDMIDSIFFNDGPNPNTILKLKEIRNDISVSVSNMNEKENIDKINKKYKGSKRVILNMGGLSRGKKIDKDTVNYALSLGYKVKAAVIDDLEFAKKVQSWGVNYITTDKLHPFLIENEYEEPILLKCTQFDVLADCRLGPEVKLIDNEIYNIYYSENIYDVYKNVNDQPIGEFKYLDTKQLDDLYYTVMKFDFEKGYILLNSSIRIKKGNQLRGKVGPANYRNHAADCYQYDFICQGTNTHELDCNIIKDDPNVVKFEGNYSIYSVENYSLYIPQNSTKENSLFGMNLNNNGSKNSKIIYFSSIIFIIIATFIIICAIKNRKGTNQLKEIKIVENAYIPETANLNKQI